jgi:hypothetical protein
LVHPATLGHSDHYSVTAHPPFNTLEHHWGTKEGDVYLGKKNANLMNQFEA